MGSVYKAFAISVLVLYAAIGLTGWELGGGEKRSIPESVRQSPGGARSFHFWHVGYHGGK